MATLGCIKAKMGNTTYYMTKIKAGELIDKVGIAKELPEWENMTVDEKMQREYDIKRIVEEIVPYVVDDPDRFFGSLIIDVFKGFDDIEFEPLTDVIKDLPVAYRIPMQDMGCLTLPGAERLIALDGQHRLLSLKIAIRGQMGVPAGVKIKPAFFDKLVPHPELANEELSIILVEHTDNQKIRKIFNKINKYAKQTSRSDNIITSDDDPFAVISRRLIKDGSLLAPINGIEVVNAKNNTLSTRSKNLTTLSALYSTSEVLLKERRFTNKVLPSEEELEDAYFFVEDFWKTLLERVDIYQDYVSLTRQNKPVSSLREKNILLKPVTQMALSHVALMAARKGVEWSEVCDRLNRVDWSFNNELWFNILVIGAANKRMITGKESIRSAGMVISYLVLGNEMDSDETADVAQIIQNARNDENASMPKIVY